MSVENKIRLAIVITVLGLISYFYVIKNIHFIISFDLQTLYDSELEAGNIKWREVDITDMINAAENNNTRMLCSMAKNIYDNTGGYIGIKRNHLSELQSLLTEQQILCIKQSKLFRSPRIERNLLNEIFKQGSVEEVNFILDLGADPNLIIKIETDEEYVSQAFFVRTYNHRYETKKVYRHSYKGVGYYKTEKYMTWDTDSIPVPIDAGSTEEEIKEYARVNNLPSPVTLKKKKAYKFTPIIIAAQRNQFEVVKKLIASGANVNHAAYGPKGKMSAIDVASSPDIILALKLAKSDYSKIEKLVIIDEPDKFEKELSFEQFAELDDKEKNKLFLLALENGSYNVIKMLIEEYSHRYDSESGEIFARIFAGKNANSLEFILSRGVDLKKQVSRKELHDYFTRKDSVFAMTIAAKTGNFDEYNNYNDKKMALGALLIDHAKSNKLWDLAFLLDAHASDWTKLHHAVVSNDPEIVIGVLSKYPELIDVQDLKGRTPVSLAVYYRLNDSFDELLNHTPDLEVEDNQGVTSLMLAAYHGRLYFTKKLVENGASFTSKAYSDCNIVKTLVSRRHSYLAYILKKAKPFGFNSRIKKQFDMDGMEQVMSYLRSNSQLPKCTT